MRVLVVDDQDVMRRVIVNLLRKFGVTDVVEANSAPAALQAAARQPVALVVTDWNMPGMTGLEFLRTLRSAAGTEHVPVMMVTTRDDEQDVLEAIRSGVSAYVVKPFTCEGFLERLAPVASLASSLASRRDAP